MEQRKVLDETIILSGTISDSSVRQLLLSKLLDHRHRTSYLLFSFSGAGTKLKVGGKIICRAPPLLGSTSTISRLGERFRDGQYSLAIFLFAALLLRVPLVPSHL